MSAMGIFVLIHRVKLEIDVELGNSTSVFYSVNKFEYIFYYNFDTDKNANLVFEVGLLKTLRANA